jgi:predicted nuclease of predicted toxin-antitoxin system
MVAGIRLLANMNISPQTVEALQQQGWDIIRVSQILPVSASDQETLELARREDRAVVTQDLDFSSLLALGGYDRPSLITLRLSVSDPETVTRRLLELLPRLEQVLQEGCAVTIEEVAVRIRRLPIGLS